MRKWKKVSDPDEETGRNAVGVAQIQLMVLCVLTLHAMEQKRYGSCRLLSHVLQRLPEPRKGRD